MTMSADNMKRRLQVAAAVLATAVALFANEAQSAASSCGSGDTQILYQSNTKCTTSSSGVSNLATPEVTVDTCCGIESTSSWAGLLDDDSSSDDSICRYVETSSAYCEDGTDCELNSTDTMTISLNMYTTAANETCCRSCKCVGDPDCVSFDGTPASWVLCDGRRKSNCKQGRKPCRRQRDHLGNRCKWIKKDPLYEGWDEDGSPCQVDWEKSGHPTMTMYQRGLFASNLTLGERGVIVNLTISTGDTGAEYVLNAARCFEYDPRSNPDTYAEAWYSPTGDAIPSTWSVSIPNEVEIKWRVLDNQTNTIVEVLCTNPPDTNRTRLDVKKLYSLDDETDDDEYGFCVTNTIDRGLATTKYNSYSDGGQADYEFQQKCLVKTLPTILATCKIIMGAQCNPYSLDSYVTEWCENADLTYTDLQGDVNECIDMLVTSGTDSVRGARWTRYLCQLNRVDDVDECVALVSQFGWASFLETNSNGLNDDSTSSSCASNVTLYSKLEGDDATCALGIFVDYQLTNGTWVQAFFIPSDLPPCDAELSVDGSQYPELFMYPIRFRQCTLSASCLEETGCAPTVGFDVSLNFDSSVCPLGERDTCFSSECSMDSTTSTSPQTVCETQPSDLLSLGSCESCCTSDNILDSGALSGSLESDDSTALCRQVLTTAPFCDASDSSMTSICDSLITSNGQGVLTVNLTLNTTEMSCCKNCAAWGDPLVSSFDGEISKWINCDGRNSNCAIKEDVCESQLDHAGNACVYNSAIADLIKVGSDIGAYGSPCQSNVTLSGEAILTMYEGDGFRVNITNGERSVITHMSLETTYDNYTLDAALCFNDDPYDAWTTASGNEIDSAYLGLDFSATDNDDQYIWAVRDLENSLFMRIRCIRMTSSAGYTGGYRMNIESLIDIETDRTDTDGFCESGVIDTGLATINSNGEICQENIEDIVDFCRAVATPSCMLSEIATEVQNWCDTANVFQTSEDHAQECYDYIKPSRKKTTKILNAWEEIYCDAVASLRDSSQSVDQWRTLCVSRLQNEGFASVVAELGDGRLTSSSQSLYCASSASEYSLKSESDGCMPGISVEYLNSTGDWVESFFVPQSLPPCGNQLVIDAVDFPELFLNQIRFKQCELDTTECPVGTHTDSYCATAQGYTISYMYSYNAAICGNDS
mmetsp:Transcript_20766/g.36339  ORF Transcript_20766/g.36339 Transcript_20766/m.36339 type:complete len:1158 (-) Transcript_20766:380-3853(-)